MDRPRTRATDSLDHVPSGQPYRTSDCLHDGCVWIWDYPNLPRLHCHCHCHCYLHQPTCENNTFCRVIAAGQCCCAGDSPCLTLYISPSPCPCLTTLYISPSPCPCLTTLYIFPSPPLASRGYLPYLALAQNRYSRSPCLTTNPCFVTPIPCRGYLPCSPSERLSSSATTQHSP